MYEYGASNATFMGLILREMHYYNSYLCHRKKYEWYSYFSICLVKTNTVINKPVCSAILELLSN